MSKFKQKSNYDTDYEKRPKRVVKGSDKSSKHRKSLYNMLLDEDDNLDLDDSDVDDTYIMHNHKKQR